MECDDVVTLSDLAYCQGEDALIYIGEMEEYSGYEDATLTRIMFTNLATQHKTVIAVGGEFLPELVIHSEDFTPVPGHTYRVEATRYSTGGGITPIRMKPYEVIYTGYEVSDTAYDAFLVRFVKVFTMTPTVSVSTEQHMSVPE